MEAPQNRAKSSTTQSRVIKLLFSSIRPDAKCPTGTYLQSSPVKNHL